jgi:hypothetical protein
VLRPVLGDGLLLFTQLPGRGLLGNSAEPRSHRPIGPGCPTEERAGAKKWKHEVCPTLTHSDWPDGLAVTTARSASL